jgi:hypothetical protein
VSKQEKFDRKHEADGGMMDLGMNNIPFFSNLPLSLGAHPHLPTNPLTFFVDSSGIKKRPL